MAKIDPKTVQTVFTSTEVIGQALGRALPVLMQHPPTSIEAVTGTLEALSDLYEKLFAAARAEHRPPLDAAFINAMIDGLTAWRRDN